MSNEYKDWERDKIAEENEIVARYPFLRVRDIDGTVDTEAKFPLMPLEIPDGWYKLFFQMCEDIKSVLTKEGNRALNDFFFIQCKEKYNQLVCYTCGSESQEVRDIIEKYKHMAQYVCTKCGKPAVYETVGYIASFCKECYKNLGTKAENAVPLGFKMEFVTIEPNDKWRKRTMSFESEWSGYCNDMVNS